MIVSKRKDLFLGLLLLVAPTILISFPLLEYVGEHYSLLFIDTNFLVTLFSSSLIAAYILHSTRLRFFLVFALLLLLINFAYQSISSFPFTEFDAYYIANRFRINASIFAIGWFTGFGISRWRYFLIFFSLILIGLSVISISAIGETDVNQLVWLLAPPVFYVFYILFIKELLYNVQKQAKTNYGKVFLRVVGFVTLIFMLFWLSTQILGSKFQQIEDQIASNSEGEGDDGGGGQSNSDDDNMLDKDNNNFFRLKEYTQLRPRLRQSEELLFSAYIDNFIGEDVPNPQYITLYHLNQYNVDLERFEIDPDNVANDLYLPDPTEIPNYFIHTDTTVLANDRMEREIKQVKSSIYINQLSPDVFVAPSTAFSCQPISVEEEFKDQYKFAYNVYSEVSTLNSAYFVYNGRDPALEQFQEQRYQILREVESYNEESQDFMDYYTRMPEGKTFTDIQELAIDITKDAETPIDKVIAIRDFFLSKDKNGEALFTYTLTPGSPTDPNIPDASLLYNFLFNTKKGYCTYFATSTLFMLRSLGIPVRMAVGFLTVDRSHNNPGWYWFYADQAHAWTQVYFPEYGWLDFDMTISNEDAENAPQPDATPPTPPTTAHFVGKGVIMAIDTTDRSMEIKVDELLVKQEGMDIPDTRDFDLDARKATVYAGKESIDFKKLAIGDTAVVVSFDEKINRMRRKRQSETIGQYLDRLPDIINISEVHVAAIEEEEEAEEADAASTIAASVNKWVTYLLIITAAIIVSLIVAPYLHYSILLSNVRSSKNINELALAIYKHLHFVLNQMGVGRGSVTPLVYAADKVDPQFQTNMAAFIEAYLKLKYSQEKLTEEETTIIKEFYPNFNDKVLSKYSARDKFLNFLKTNRWFYYLLNLNLTK